MARRLLVASPMPRAVQPPDRLQRSLHKWRRAGLFSDLGEAEALRFDDPGRHPVAGSIPPGLLRGYYAADGDEVEAGWRRQADRYVEVGRDAPPDAVAAAIELAIPELAPLRVENTAPVIFVSAGSDVASISRVIRWTSRRASQVRSRAGGPQDVVRAVNVLLARREQRRRFVELRADPERHVFVAIDARQARALHRWGATDHAHLGVLWSFTGWDGLSTSAAS